MYSDQNTSVTWEEPYTSYCPTYILDLVRMVGLEPTRLAAPRPKPGASTNFATSAFCDTPFGVSFDIIFSENISHC